MRFPFFDTTRTRARARARGTASLHDIGLAAALFSEVREREFIFAYRAHTHGVYTRSFSAAVVSRFFAIISDDRKQTFDVREKDIKR